MEKLLSCKSKSIESFQGTEANYGTTLVQLRNLAQFRLVQFWLVKSFCSGSRKLRSTYLEGSQLWNFLSLIFSDVWFVPASAFAVQNAHHGPTQYKNIDILYIDTWKLKPSAMSIFSQGQK